MSTKVSAYAFYQKKTSLKTEISIWKWLKTSQGFEFELLFQNVYLTPTLAASDITHTGGLSL